MSDLLFYEDVHVPMQFETGKACFWRQRVLQVGADAESLFPTSSENHGAHFAVVTRTDQTLPQRLQALYVECVERIGTIKRDFGDVVGDRDVERHGALL